MAIVLSGGATVGNQGHGATCKPYGVARIQFDTDGGTYAAGGMPNFTAFVQTILGSKVTPIDMFEAMPGGPFRLYWDQTTDTLRAFVAATGVEVSAGIAVALTNAEITVIYE